MTTRIQITLAIIIAIAVGCGTMFFRLLLAIFGRMFSDQATIIAAGVAILVAGLSAMVARANDSFRELEDRDD